MIYRCILVTLVIKSNINYILPNYDINSFLRVTYKYLVNFRFYICDPTCSVFSIRKKERRHFFILKYMVGSGGFLGVEVVKI